MYLCRAGGHARAGAAPIDTTISAAPFKLSNTSRYPPQHNAVTATLHTATIILTIARHWLLLLLLLLLLLALCPGLLLPLPLLALLGTPARVSPTALPCAAAAGSWGRAGRGGRGDNAGDHAYDLQEVGAQVCAHLQTRAQCAGYTLSRVVGHVSVCVCACTRTCTDVKKYPPFPPPHTPAAPHPPVHTSSCTLWNPSGIPVESQWNPSGIPAHYRHITVHTHTCAHTHSTGILHT